MKRICQILFICTFFQTLLGQSDVQNFGKRFGKTITSSSTTTPKERSESVPFEWKEIELERAIIPQNYIIGPGDVFGVDIILKENINIELIVSPTGEILIPSIGVVNVNGLQLDKGINKIVQSINNVYPSAQVNVILLSIRTFKIQLAGAVNKPGFFNVTAVTRLDEIIEMAAGFQQFAREFNIEIIRNNGKIDTVNYFNYQINGDLTHNPTFNEGDKIYVPFANPDKESIVLRGAISGVGYDVIANHESLGNYLRRQARFVETADLENVTITRKKADSLLIITVFPKDFNSTFLECGDAIDILTERGISVNGFVQAPGSFYYYPGYSYLDYINMAGGNTIEGDIEKAIVRHLDGKIETGKNAILKRGDVIMVPRTNKSIMYGDLSILEIITSLSTTLLAFIAATR
jgi:protein involved in polysaccharide export with SLBB domain